MVWYRERHTPGEQSLEVIMEDKLQFQKRLEKLMEEAKDAGDRMSQERIEEYFREDSLSGEQLAMIKEYLLARGITVTGCRGDEALAEGKKKKLSPDEEAYLKKYRNELSLIRKEEEGERARLIREVIMGDALAKGRLAELYLEAVAEIAEKIAGPDIFLGDAVAEGNVNLLLAVERLDTEADADAFIKEEIRRGILELNEEQSEQKRRDEMMVNKVERLEAAMKELTEDEDTKFSIEELSFYLEMTEEEIRDILNLTGEDK